MARAGRIRESGAIAIALLLAATLVPPSPTAASGDEAVILPGTTLASATVDLDGDGEREVVRITGDDGYALDAWRHDGTAWSILGSTSVPRAEPGGDGPRDPVDSSALLSWQFQGRERLLVLAAVGERNDPYLSSCCLAISEVDVRSGRLEVRPLQEVGGGAQLVQVADLDGDGSDELLLHEMQVGIGSEEGSGQTATLAVLRWTEGRFERIFERSDPAFLSGPILAETDGVEGIDVLFGLGDDGGLHRLAWAGGELREEDTVVETVGPRGGWVMGVADRAILLAMSDAISVVRWPRGESATGVNRISPLLNPSFAVLGEGRDTIVIGQDGFGFELAGPPTTTVYDAGLRPLGEAASSPEMAAFWELFSERGGRAYGSTERILYPYSGPLHGVRIDGAAAYAANGVLVQPDGVGGYRTQPMAALVGTQPVGTAGPGDGWIVLGDSFGTPPGTAFLSWGGLGAEWGRLAILPLDALLQPPDDRGIVAHLRNAVEVARAGHTVTLFADGAGFEAEVSAAPGSTVIVVSDGRLREHEVDAAPVRIEIVPPRDGAEDENAELDATILIVGPDGRSTSERWTGTFLREPPALRVRAATDALSPSATLDGRATPGSRVSVDGRPLEIDATGRFSASVDAPIWPSQVVVTARDPLGNEATELVEVLGVIDYRGLPWAAIILVATLVAGAVLYVRTPRGRPAAAVAGDDARLEELDADVVD